MPIQFLKKLELFNGLSTEELQEIKAIMQEKNYAKNEMIFMEGAEANNFYIILTGLVKVFKTDEQGREKTLSLLGNKDFFGEMALLDNNSRSASVQAIDESKIFKISRKKFKRLVTEYPEISLKIIATLSQRLRNSNQQIQNLTFKQVKGRLLDSLKQLADKYGVEQENGILINKKITHQELANLVGTTRATITKLLGELIEEDKVEIKNRYLILKK
ncbi:Crp/Fnr family transcriptional regulator [Halanaerobacter jeridensis]|uniref:CRP/FNR family transcriptional regulator n=1 Tax=Halanaerobacter jeridensis TaxID=706427 RepID=A0A939BP79_9FIRM|nr:Crp/Fnr family transcriptional regulator [Halanaerobacter jeridensis]MBM7556672.1 CRP/FNR family transcriptional regulator [Halanaerobacter jeridensis]